MKKKNNNSFNDMFRILWYSYIRTENLYTSIFGLDYSKIKFNWNLSDWLNRFSEIFIPKLPFAHPRWLNHNIKNFFYGNSSKFIESKKNKKESDICVIFVNGILGSISRLQSTVDILEEKLDKPVDLIYNATDCLCIDIIESLIGKETTTLTEPDMIAFTTISKKLFNSQIKKVIVISYSQGTIILAKVLQTLKRMGIKDETYLKKLEVYAISNCSSKMNYIYNKLPYIENLANKHDFVAKLGCNAPDEISDIISIDGVTYIDNYGYGHFLNEHYLLNFEKKFPKSKLITYFKK